jgi:molybdate/tungstate transport system ATP-binding protein
MEDSGFICLVGKNGSGKTVLLNIIAGFTIPDEGYVRVNGLDITRLPVESRGVVMVTPGSSIPHLQVDSHLLWGSKLNRVFHNDERIAKVKAELGIDFGGRVSKLSLGMKERVALATALLSSPKVILVDEAFSNLHSREEFMGSYRRLTSEAGIDLVFTTQDPNDGLLSDHVYMMTEGTAKKMK